MAISYHVLDGGVLDGAFASSARIDVLDHLAHEECGHQDMLVAVKQEIDGNVMLMPLDSFKLSLASYHSKFHIFSREKGGNTETPCLCFFSIAMRGMVAATATTAHV